MPRCGPRATRRRNTEARERSATWIYYSLATNPTREAAALTAPFLLLKRKILLVSSQGVRYTTYLLHRRLSPVGL